MNRLSAATFGAIITLGGMLASAVADDPTIPLRCRPSDAVNEPKCEAIVQRAFVRRNVALGERDQKGNAVRLSALLSSKTASGLSVADTLRGTATLIPFQVNSWNFVYSRSGAEYVVLDYGASYEKPPAFTDKMESLSIFDDDLGGNRLGSLENSSAAGYVTWKVDGDKLQPWGSYANMFELGPDAFASYVNLGRKGSDNSGYMSLLTTNFGFLTSLMAGSENMANHVDSKTATNLTFFWNVLDGYVFQADNYPCPGTKYGLFTVRGIDCQAKAMAAKDISGQVLPFKIIHAFRNLGLGQTMVGADVSVSVQGGKPADWMATAAYVAEHSLVNNATFTEAGVFVENPWGDDPPQMSKLLAKAYDAPDAAEAPWKEVWTVLSSEHAADLPNIEYDKLSNDLIDDPSVTPDPNVRLDKAAAAARARVIAKYDLPSNWQPAENLGGLQEHAREHIHIDAMQVDAVMAAMASLAACLSSDAGNGLIVGCTPDHADSEASRTLIPTEGGQ